MHKQQLRRRSGIVVVGRTSIALFMSSIASAGAGPLPCLEAANSMPVGSAATSNMLDGVKEVVDAIEEPDTGAVLGKWSVDRGFSKSVAELNREGQADTRVKWLLRNKVGAVEIVVGTANCQHLRFFRVEDGRVIGIPAPEGLTSDDACWGDSVWLGSIGGTPYAVEENDVVGDRTRSILASGWLGNSWGPNCRLIQTYSITLKIDGRFCKRPGDCTALEAVALEQANSLQRKQERTPAIDSDRETASTVDAVIAALPSQIPTFGSEPTDGFTTFSHQKSFRVPHIDEPLVGMVGGGQRGWRDYDGWLVGFWRATTNGYEPVAGFRFERQLGTVRSIRLENR